MSRSLFACAVAGALAFTVGVGAQEPKPQTPPTSNPPSATRPPMSQDQATAVTVEGCLFSEADVPGRKPNTAERAGVSEDYILTTTKMIKGSAPAAGAQAPRPGDTPTGTTGARASLSFDVKGIDKDDLKKHAGQRVQIDGTFQNLDRAQSSATPGTPADLVELRGTAIRPVTGECAAK